MRHRQRAGCPGWPASKTIPRNRRPQRGSGLRSQLQAIGSTSGAIACCSSAEKGCRRKPDGRSGDLLRYRLRVRFAVAGGGRAGGCKRCGMRDARRAHKPNAALPARIRFVRPVARRFFLVAWRPPCISDKRSIAGPPGSVRCKRARIEYRSSHGSRPRRRSNRFLNFSLNVVYAALSTNSDGTIEPWKRLPTYAYAMTRRLSLILSESCWPTRDTAPRCAIRPLRFSI